jgi:hypothetical protein
MYKNSSILSDNGRFGRFIYSLKEQGNLSYTARRAAGATSIRGCFNYN